MKPFISRVRYAPEVASKPDRLKKDLENARTLARLLEDQFKSLRTMKFDPVEKNGDASADANGGDGTSHDVDMDAGIKEEDDPEPREMGSEAVERRVQKVMSDLQEQGHLDGLDEKAIETKQVRH